MPTKFPGIALGVWFNLSISKNAALIRNFSNQEKKNKNLHLPEKSVEVLCTENFSRVILKWTRVYHILPLGFPRPLLGYGEIGLHHLNSKEKAMN